MNTVSETIRPWRWLALVCALALLNGSLTFANYWPTPAVVWTWDLSIEFAVLLLAFALAHRVFGRLPRPLAGWMAGVWLLLVISRYADVTAPAIYGREVNLYWDVRHLGAVVSMMASAVSAWITVALIAIVVLVSVLAHRILKWAFARVVAAMHERMERRAITALAAALLIVFAGQQIVGDRLGPEFATPVSESYVRQARRLVMTPAVAIPAARRLDSSLAALGGADVILVFVESYGAVSYDNPSFAEQLDPRRADLGADIKASGRSVVSAFVTSPTFGGSSWLAHVSLLSGVEVRDEDTNVRLMAQARDTLVTAFSRGGYRTVAAMPGNSHPWPEGAFYRYDEIYDRARLAYAGPKFGWWYVPDQFTLAKIDSLEIARAPRRPLFVVVPTISTHAPFGPTAPYQTDWDRLLSDTPYDESEVEAALAREPDLLNMGPSYVNAVSYTYASIGGYLRRRADRDLVMIVIGDHQPAAAVAGEGASWDVPVHVISNRMAVLDRLQTHGFEPGLNPDRRTLGPMHGLLPMLLDAFAGPAEPPGLHAD